MEEGWLKNGGNHAMDGREPNAQQFLKRNSDRVVLADLLGGQVAVYSNRSPFKESANEDAAAFLELETGAAVLLVADGVGGIRGGEVASGLAIRTVCDHLLDTETGNNRLRTRVLDGIEAANQRILKRGSGAATTLNIITIDNGMVRSYHVGDSMTIVVGQRGKLKYQTICHSPIGFAVESGILTESEALFHEQRHLVSNVVGSVEMRIEMGPPVPLAARDTVLLGSDGLFDNLSSQEVVNNIRIGRLEKSMRRMLAETRARMNSNDDLLPSKPDDLTAVVYRPWKSNARKTGVSGCEPGHPSEHAELTPEPVAQPDAMNRPHFLQPSESVDDVSSVLPPKSSPAASIPSRSETPPPTERETLNSIVAAEHEFSPDPSAGTSVIGDSSPSGSDPSRTDSDRMITTEPKQPKATDEATDRRRVQRGLFWNAATRRKDRSQP